MMSYEIEPRIDLGDYRSWLQEQPDGGFALVDPLRGEVVDSHQPPEFLMDDPRLARGFDFLVTDGQRVDLTILYGSHNEASDLEIPQGPTFEERVAEADVYICERFNWRRDRQEERLQAAREQGIYPDFKDTFTAREFEAIAASGTPSASMDTEGVRSSVEDVLRSLLVQSINIGSPHEKLLATLVVDYLREWYMVGKLGFELSHLEPNARGWRQIFHRAAQIDLPPFEVFATAGESHRDLSRKLGLYNVPVSEVDQRKRPPSKYARLLAAASSTGRIPALSVTR